MKAISIFTVGAVVFLVLLRMNGVSTEVLVLDAMVRVLMESMYLA